MDMGTGKTKVALDLIANKINKIDYVLWICPLSLKEEIERERIKWHPELTLDVVGCESIGASDRIYLNVLNKVSNHKTFIVVDESLKIKNRHAKRTERIMELGRHSEYRLILNGTPISKNVLDLWTQMEFLSPKILNMSYIEFKNTYCEYYLHGRMKNRVKKQHNIKHLISLIEPYIFESKLNLNKVKNYCSIDYPVEDTGKYQSIKEKFLQLDFDSDTSFFALATSLQQYYCSTETKLKVVENLINRIDGQVIVFVKYINSVPANARSIVGDKTIKEREETLQEFRNGEFKALYITYGCGTFGLNLQFCKNIIFADHTFDYAQRLQAEARIYRLGQENNVYYYNIDCICGMDNLIRKCLDKKSRLLDEVKTQIQILGQEEWLKRL